MTKPKNMTPEQEAAWLAKRNDRERAARAENLEVRWRQQETKRRYR